MNELPITPWVEKFLIAWIPLFVAIDPIGLVPVFLGLTHDMDTRERRVVAKNATLTAAGVAIVFVFLGKSIFKILGISVADFQMAGGLILFLLASGDIVSRERLETADSRADIGIVPLGLPMIAGPAMLTTLIIMVDSVGILATLVSLVFNMTLVVLALKYSDRLARWIGMRGMRAIHKIVALLLAAIAVNMIRRGWQSIF
jgi:multiple antibiotic resistance protein